MILTRDQTGNEIKLASYPKKIISLVPSISELLWDLHLEEEIAGITKFCIHPDEMFQTKPRIGGTKKTDHDAIRNIQPDLIIGNKEENTKKDIEQLRLNYPVWMSDVNSFTDAIEMIREIGRITDREQEAENIISKIHPVKPPEIKLRIIYLIWKDPFMCAGTATFINDMIHEAGFENCITKERYPEISLEDIQKNNPDYLFLSTEPFPFKKEHFELFEKYFPSERIRIVDGEMFSWYGSRLIPAYDYFKQLQKML